MGATWETICVGLVVATAVLWALRAMRRSVRQKKMCRTCGSSDGCPLANASSGETRGVTDSGPDPAAQPSCGHDAPRSAAE